MKLTTAISVLVLLPLAACVTTREPTAEERAYCERMETQMGTHEVHDHNQMKGVGIDPMNVTHARCRQMLGLD